MTPYQFVYGKACHLPVELKYKAYWVIKEMNLDLDAAMVKRRIQISKLEEMRLKAYENASIYKERIKRWYDKRLKKKEFKEGDKVLLYNSRFKTFGKGNCKACGLIGKAMRQRMEDLERVVEDDYKFLNRNVRKLFGMVGNMKGKRCNSCGKYH
jgi:CDP-glycerol glycerophosphotransferase (TagB/SpsB family)